MDDKKTKLLVIENAQIREIGIARAVMVALGIRLEDDEHEFMRPGRLDSIMAAAKTTMLEIDLLPLFLGGGELLKVMKYCSDFGFLLHPKGVDEEVGKDELISCLAGSLTLMHAMDREDAGLIAFRTVKRVIRWRR